MARDGIAFVKQKGGVKGGGLIRSSLFIFHLYQPLFLHPSLLERYYLQYINNLKIRGKIDTGIFGIVDSKMPFGFSFNEITGLFPDEQSGSQSLFILQAMAQTCWFMILISMLAVLGRERWERCAI
jgi:hypothetical protein